MGLALKVAVAAVILFAVGVALLWLLQRHLYYFPDRGDVPRAASVIAGAEDVTLRTDDGLDLGAWYVPAADDAPERDLTVLVANGNAGDRAGRSTLARALSDAGFAVLLFDYRGYGGNPGSPSEGGLARDVRAAYAFLTRDRGVPPTRLLYFGESLGTGVVTELATEHPPAGLVLRSPFVDFAEVGREHFPDLAVRLLLRDRYPVAEYLADITAPITVIYGTADTVVAPEQSRRVAELAGAVDVIEIPDAGHNDAVMFGDGPVVDAVERLAGRIDP